MVIRRKHRKLRQTIWILKMSIFLPWVWVTWYVRELSEVMGWLWFSSLGSITDHKSFPMFCHSFTESYEVRWQWCCDTDAHHIFSIRMWWYLLKHYNVLNCFLYTNRLLKNEYIVKKFRWSLWFLYFFNFRFFSWRFFLNDPGGYPSYVYHK